MRQIVTAIAGATAVVCLLAPSIASAQTSQVLGRNWEDAVSAPGVKIGEGTVLHPVAGAETGIINNVFYEDTDGRTAGVFRIVGELAIATLPPGRQGSDETDKPAWTPWAGGIYQTYDGPFFRTDSDADSENVGAPPKMEFRAGLRAFYEEMISGTQAVRDQRNLGLNANAHLHLFPYETFAFTIDNDLTRAIRPTNFESSQDLNRWINNFRLGMRIQMGGRAIVPELRYTNRIDYFESSNSRFANRVQHNFGLKVNWWLARFTQFYFDGSFGLFQGLGDNMVDGVEFKRSSSPLRLRLGTNTALTEKVSTQAYIGFGKGFYSSGSDFTGILASIGITYKFNPFGNFGLNYSYDFRDSINSNFYTEHKIAATITQQIDRLLLEGRGGLHLRHYDGIPMTISNESVRNDFIIALSGVGKYLLRDWLAATASIQLASDQTQFRSTSEGNIDDPSFTRFEIFAGMAAAF